MGRLGRSLLELGGNNAINTPDADIKMTVIGAVFELWELQDKDVLTRRLIIHESIYDKVKDAVVAATSN
jgi:aldehyde dehydrogenase (NAD+)